MNKILNTSFLTAGVLAVTFLFNPASTRAEVPANAPARLTITDQDIQLLRQDIRDKRRQVVAANLPMTTEESAKFWPVYNRYIAETVTITDARLERIKAYVANYATLTDQQAAEHVTKLFEADKAMIDLRIKYLSNFDKVLPKKKAAMFAQMDRRLQMMIDLQIASGIPLISPK